MLPDSGPPEAGVFRLLKCSPFLDRPEPEFSGVFSHAAAAADEPFMSDIGGLLPIAL